MSTLIIAAASFIGFIIAYHTYGRWLSRKIFRLDKQALVPSHELRDDVDFCPTDRQIIFGHHFTSIAGTGPIVGPAIAVFWGWLPALLWVVFGSIFVGAVHDLGAMVVSLRNRGQTVGEVAGRLISPRAKVLFLLVLFFALTIVLAIFGLVVASIFRLYPETVLSVWLVLPMAVGLGFWVYKFKGNIWGLSLIALAMLYAAVYVGAEYLPISLAAIAPESDWLNPTVLWTLALFVYCFFASVLPVWVLLQPRDFINSLQLVLALGLLIVGIVFVGLTGQADLTASAPAIVPAAERPADAPPILPFLFITIACGACSGFHCLVSSGTSSKQVNNETDAQYVGYGAMLLEGALAVIVILACCAGVGMGHHDRVLEPTSNALIAPYSYPADGDQLTGRAAWRESYDLGAGWKSFGLKNAVAAFVDGGANFLQAVGIPLKFAIGMIAVMVACFAATTLDTATRLQRYVVQELAVTLHIKPLENKYLATLFALSLALGMALMRGPANSDGSLKAPGTGGLILWPLFGATNQLLAGLAFMVTLFYLWRRGKRVWFVALPMLLMVIMPAWALSIQMFDPVTGWWWNSEYMLFSIGAIAMGLQIWMVIEALICFRKARGVLEPGLPPLEKRPLEGKPAMEGGSAC